MGYIYKITNKINGATYIGSTIRKNPRKRWWRHVKDLKNNIHHSRFLQRAWNKYGSISFEFSIIEEVLDENILECEQKYLNDRKHNFPSNLNYNVCWVAGNCKGRRFSQETIQKLRQSHIGIRHSIETKYKQMKIWENKCKTPYSFTDPNGIVYDNVRNLRMFGRNHNLTGQSLKRVYDGKISNHKGWIKTGNKRLVYEIIDMSSNKYYHIDNLKSFCRDKEINYKVIHKYCFKLNKPYKNWMVIKKEI